MNTVLQKVLQRLRPPQKPKIQNHGRIGEYEQEWDRYAQIWKTKFSGRLAHVGDEWIGQNAGAANSLSEFESVIEESFIKPYVDSEDDVLEIGVGGGKTSRLLLKHCRNLTCADISSEMLKAARDRLGNQRVSYVKLDGVTFNGISKGSADICFSFDTLVHVEPRDIFNYLTLIPSALKGKRLCIFHHADILTDRGWQLFLRDWKQNLMGNRQGAPFSVMTDGIMERFLTHLNYEIIFKDSRSVPRDCVWICKAPKCE